MRKWEIILARTLRPSKGTTILEVLVGAFIAALVLVPLVSLAGGSGHFLHRLDERATAHQTVRLVTDVISRDIRQAGFDPTGTALAPLVAANAHVLGLQQDTGGDGSIDRRSRELITYAFRPATGTLSRIVGRQSMPLVTGLPDDGFWLDYLDATGRHLPAGADGLDAAARRAVRWVSVGIIVRDRQGEPLAGTITNVTIRNQPWTPQGRSPEV